MYANYNPNPLGKAVGDCTVRAIAKATGQTWDKTYLDLCVMGYELADMPSANAVWGEYLKRKGFKRYAPSCDDICTVRQFAADNREGAFVLALSGHVVAVIDGDYCDAWDSGSETVLYVWRENK